MARYINLKIWLPLCLMFLGISCKTIQHKASNVKPTICIVGGTPSTTDILNYIPDSLKAKYNFISFNRPGYGGSALKENNEALLYELAKNAGLKKYGYAVIGTSGGGPIAMLLASKFKLKHCGVISGMVSKDAYFKFADKAVTKELFTNLLLGYSDFEKAVLKFPNLDKIASQAGTASEEIFIKATFNDLNYILSEPLYAAIDKDIYIDWWHGENDVNVPFKSAEMFLKNYKNATLHIIPDAGHEIDSTIYLQKLIDSWQKDK